MARRSRPRTVQVPPGATTIRIPTQRGTKNAPPVFVVVSESRPSLSSRLARAAGGWAWRHRASWAPTAYAALAYLLTTVIHLIAPWMVFLLAPAAPVPLLALWWTRVKQPERVGERPGRLLTATALATLAVAWAAAVVYYGPFTVALAWAWVGLMVAVQVFWLVVRRSK
ncbi:hypothetical protein ACFY9F_24395 [Streptomyces sp. NPDC012421]|uniref:hypothetical protein n=1 Tax=Streptomyces sp. NPDC012421 TaxID=3364832 RepID=UPI0036EEDAC1